MSTNKHRGYRKVLSIESFNTEYNGALIPCTRVLWCIPDATTSRTVKTRHIGVTTYVGSVKFNGISAWAPRKAVSISLKDPLASKFFTGVRVESTFQESFNRAYHAFILGDDSRCKGLKGIVRWWSEDTGTIDVSGQVYRVHACNINGAKTWYPGTACMYLNEGDTVTVDLRDMGDHLTCRVTSGGQFDAAKWASLDHSKLAFKCDDTGKAINGLFE